MKKSAIILLALILLITSCSKNETRVSLNQLPDDYSLDDAKSDNCVVFEDLDITYGQSEWDDFVKATENGKSVSVRLAFYYTLDDPSHYSEEYYEEIKDDFPALYIQDLSFDGDKYIIEGFEDGQLNSKEYKYLMKYEGQPRSETAVYSTYTYYVLVDDNTVTWDDIEHGMLSSQSGAWIDHYLVYSDIELSQSEETTKITEPPTDELEDTNEPIITPYSENEDYVSAVTPILLNNPPYDYYISNDVIDKEVQALKLNLITSEPNGISDEGEWFINNNLTINTYQMPDISQDITGNLPDGIDLYWNGLIITAAIYDDSYIYCTYGSEYPEGYILNIYDAKSLQIVYSIDFSNYRYSPDYIEKDYAFIQQKVNWVAINNNILYVSHSHSTYAKSSNNMNAYITAIDLSDMSILWRTNALVSNSHNFLIIDDVIICGYGFTYESDYLYQLNIHTGEVIEKISLKSAPSYIIEKNNVLYVRTYNTDYQFDITQ